MFIWRHSPWLRRLCLQFEFLLQLTRRAHSSVRVQYDRKSTPLSPILPKHEQMGQAAEGALALLHLRNISGVQMQSVIRESRERFEQLYAHVTSQPWQVAESSSLGTPSKLYKYEEDGSSPIRWKV